MTQDRSILVLGAGELGMAVLRGLAEQRTAGTALTVLLRPETIESSDAGKRKNMDELRALGVALLPGDLAASSIPELAATFARFETVVSCTGFVAGSGTQRKLAQAALDGGVRRFVPWQFGVDYDAIGRGSAQELFDEQLDVRDLLRGQGRTEWVIVSTGMFTSFLFEPAFGVVDLPAKTVRALGSWDNEVTVTTAEDIGTLTARILLAEPRTANQVVYTAGDTLTYGRLAEIVERLLGKEVLREQWSVPWLNEELARNPGDPLGKYRVVFAEGKGVAWGVERTFHARLGLRTAGVEEWLRARVKSNL